MVHGGTLSCKCMPKHLCQALDSRFSKQRVGGVAQDPVPHTHLQGKISHTLKYYFFPRTVEVVQTRVCQTHHPYLLG